MEVTHLFTLQMQQGSFGQICAVHLFGTVQADRTTRLAGLKELSDRCGHGQARSFPRRRSCYLPSRVVLAQVVEDLLRFFFADRGAE